MKRLMLLGLLLAAAGPSVAQLSLLPASHDEVVPVDVRHVPADVVWGLTTPLHRPRRGPLLIVDGRVLPDSANLPPAEDIIALRELEPEQAIARFGRRAEHGVLLIETVQRKRGPKRR